ncbi:hypothetical protein KIN20_019324 [Parelaphostrongylus tenuis]|uniref:Protein-tyrosine phosphatase n=1 Tax=Parelaphostrongylus tenuis TaxID=148309 RepID=A0AAD5QV05_PARTN|nr:hypothetical protein KIN20_019324 [Parelaphostrongylus tenuis]
MRMEGIDTRMSAALDNGRVVLTIGNVSYIHANYVSTPDNEKRFICTQAPLPATCHEFWCMVVQEKSPAILMLCNFIEQEVKKCTEYFPLKAGEKLSFSNDVSVECKKRNRFEVPCKSKVNMVVSKLEVSIKGQPTHICNHYHWVDWPDRGVPEADLLPVYLLDKLRTLSGPIIVHCSAGIGRTGCIVLIEYAIELLNAGRPLLEISNYLAELRKQRNNSVQTVHQYLYVHQVLLLHLSQSKYIDTDLRPLLDKFTEDYNAATRDF